MVTTLLRSQGLRTALLLAALAGLAACNEAHHDHWKPADYIDGLIRALENQDDFTVRRAAADALAQIGPIAERAVPYLDCATYDDYAVVREAARRAIHRIQPASAALALGGRS